MAQPIRRGSRFPVSLFEPTAPWDPVSELEYLRDRMGRLYDQITAQGPGQSPWQPDIEVDETGEFYLVKAELPGITRDDVELQADEHSLSITGLVATCGIIEFELGWATRTSAEFDPLRADRDTGYEWLATHDEDWRRALDVQAALWRGGQIRAVGFPDLLIAAVAEREQVTVLHYDSDYDQIAKITGQPSLWVVPRGTVP